MAHGCGWGQRWPMAVAGIEMVHLCGWEQEWPTDVAGDKDSPWMWLGCGDGPQVWLGAGVFRRTTFEACFKSRHGG